MDVGHPMADELRWSADRLDAEFRRTYERLAAVEALMPALPRLEVGLAEVIKDAGECNAGLKQLSSDLQQRRDAEDERRRVEHIDAAKERRASRQWAVGAALAAGALVVGTLKFVLGVG